MQLSVPSMPLQSNKGQSYTERSDSVVVNRLGEMALIMDHNIIMFQKSYMETYP